MLYSIAFYSNSMFLDGVVWLPLIFMGIDKMLETGKSRLYVLSLATILCAQYYMAYILCIGATLYFAHQLLLQHKTWKAIKQNLHKVRRFVAMSAVAALISAVITLPTFISLQSAQRYVQPKDEMSTMLIPYSFADAPLQFFGVTVNSADATYATPFVFCGILIAFLVALFFISRRIRLREKILSLGLIVFFFVSFGVQPLDYAWHAFSTPNGFTFRYAFILVFILIILAYKVFLLSPRLRVLQAGVPLLFIATLQISSLLVAAVMVTYNTVSDGAHEFKQYEEVNYNIENISSLTQAISEIEPNAVYRMEKDFQYPENDPMLFEYNGLTHYSSAVEANTVSFLSRLGFSKIERISLAVKYKNSHTFAIDSLLGIKYFLATPDLGQLSGEFESDLYVNNYALPLSFMADKNLLSASTSELGYFDLQNKIFQSLSGINTPIFTKIELIPETDNLQEDILDDGSSNYTVISEDSPAYLYINAPQDEDKLYYFDMVRDESLDLEVWLDERPVELGYEALTGITLDPPLRLTEKYVESAKKSQLKVQVPKNLVVKNDSFWQESKAALGEHYAALADEPCDLRKISSSHLTCTVEAKEDGNLFFTIPNDDGWTVKVDGGKVKTETAFDLFMTIPLTAGKHEIEMKYTPRGLGAGLFVSSTALIVCAVYVTKKFWRQTERIMAVVLAVQNTARTPPR
jgi:uncharacterized membrane protein YfhO